MRTLFRFLALTIALGLRLMAGETATPLGVVYTGEEAFFDLVLRNESASALRIQQIKPRCDCITVLNFPASVAPRSVVRVPCVYRSSKSGAIQTSVEVLNASAQLEQIFNVTGFVAEKSWLATARDVLAAPAGQIVLVDVRSAQEFNRAHPLRALNLPLFSLKSRPALKAQRLVLLDEGFSPDALLGEVLNLRALGFQNVAVLGGGIAAWVKAGGTLEGPDRATARLTFLSAGNFGRASSVAPWICIQVGESPVPVVRAIPLVKVADLVELEKKLPQLMWPVSGGSAFHPVLIVSADPQLPAQIEKRLGRSASAQLYYLEGGAAALNAFTEEQAALVRHTEDPFVSRPEISRSVSRPVVSGRCGSCGG